MAGSEVSDVEVTPPRGKSTNLFGAIRRFFQHFYLRHFTRKQALKRGIAELNAHLGMGAKHAAATESREETIKTPSRDLARAVTYIPDMDGQADAGEVVWANIRPKKGMVPEQRAVLVVGRNHHRLLTLLISSREEYADKINWIPVGTGPWSTGADLDSWVRMDKVLQVPESHIQRRGIPLPARRFERVANELRQVYGWS